MGNISGSLSRHNMSPLDEKREAIFREKEQKIIQKSLESCKSKEGCDHWRDEEDDEKDHHVDETDSPVTMTDLAKYQYPFENLIFEGGGNKGLAYCGAIRCLEEIGVMPQIKRVGGSSAGALTAALVAIGYNSTDIEKFMSEDVKHIFLDHSYGYLSLVPNLITGWGWNPGRRVYDWLGEKFQGKTGCADLTFFQLYKLLGVELCIVITNLNQMKSEFCHPKTTPNMIIRQALRMSISIPVVFMACTRENYSQKDVYVDGGVLCNYPIQCFDGWYLSMDKKDAFLLHMQQLDDLSQLFSTTSRFQNLADEKIPLNQKSLGFLLYDDLEAEVMKERLERRKGAVKPDKPSKETKLFKKKLIETTIQRSLKKERAKCQKAAEAFVTALQKHNLNDAIHIDKQELRKAFEDEAVFSIKDRNKLFAKNVSVDEAFAYLDRDGNGKIDIQELLRFLESRNIQIQFSDHLHCKRNNTISAPVSSYRSHKENLSTMHELRSTGEDPISRIQGYNRTEINNFIEFGSALQNSWTTNLKYVYVGKDDYKRTVGINTGHVGTSNYELEKEDRDFIISRGYNATVAYLRWFLENNTDTPVKKGIVNENGAASVC